MDNEQLNSNNVKKPGIKRVCDYCKKEIYLNKDNIGSLIYYGRNKKTYHSNCFEMLCKHKIATTRKKEEWLNTLENIENIKKDSYIKFLNIIMKDDIYRFILNEYSDMEVVPTRIWMKLDAILNGTFKGMQKGIPANHLLDMWRQKKNYLDRVYIVNCQKGKKMKPEQRVIYDLSILVNKYNDYLKWLEKEKIKKQEQEEQRNRSGNNKSIRNKISNDLIYLKNEEKENNIKGSDDMSAIADEIFG